MIDLLIPDMPDFNQLTPYIKAIDKNKWYTNYGPLVRELEHRMSNYDMHTDMQAVTAASGTVGLTLAIMSLGLPRAPFPAKVLTPSLSFPATVSAIVACGLQPLFSDVDFDSWALTPAMAYDIWLNSDEEISLVVPVCAFGAAQDLNGWDCFTRDTGVPVIVDAAASFGNPQSAVTTTSVISLHATKSLPAGEGGVILTNSHKRASLIRRLSNFGINAETDERAVEIAGINGKMSEYHAAVALAGMDKWPETKIKRSELSLRYVEELAPLVESGRVILQDRDHSGTYSAFVVRFPFTSSHLVSGRLAEYGIATRKWYYPPQHLHPGMRWPALKMPNTDAISGHLLGLPFHLDLSQDDISKVLRVLKRSV